MASGESSDMANSERTDTPIDEEEPRKKQAKLEMQDKTKEDKRENQDMKKSGKRKKYLKWEDFFMATAILASERSKDPRKQVGACIVNKQKKIVGIGYNGMPTGIPDDDLPWEGEDQVDDVLDSKKLYVCHAEMNAVIYRSTPDVEDCRLYVTLFPCNECAKVVIQAGIKEVVYFSDAKKDKPAYKASKTLLDKAGVTYRLFEAQQEERVEIDFKSTELLYSRSQNA